MYDYLRDLGEHLTDDQLIDVFGNIAVLNEQSFCKDWVELITSVGVVGMLKLSKYFGGRTFQVPPLYQVLMIYAALVVIELEKDNSYEHAKDMVLGGLMLDGFDELVEKIKSTTQQLAPDISE